MKDKMMDVKTLNMSVSQSHTVAESEHFCWTTGQSAIVLVSESNFGSELCCGQLFVCQV